MVDQGEAYRIERIAALGQELQSVCSFIDVLSSHIKDDNVCLSMTLSGVFVSVDAEKTKSLTSRPQVEGSHFKGAIMRSAIDFERHLKKEIHVHCRALAELMAEAQQEAAS